MLMRRMLSLPALVAVLGAIPTLPGLLVLSGILAGPDHSEFFADLVNPRYFDIPVPIIAHIAAAAVFCLCAPFQFSTRLRMRAPGLHRRLGWVAVVAGVIFGLSSLPALGPVPTGVAWVRYCGLVAAGIGFSVAVTCAVFAIRNRNVAMHRAWALRAAAIGLMGGSRILIEAFAFLVFGDVSELMGGIGIWLAIGANLCLVEYHLNTRSRIGSSH